LVMRFSTLEPVSPLMYWPSRKYWLINMAIQRDQP